MAVDSPLASASAPLQRVSHRAYPPRPIRHSYMILFPYLGLIRGPDAFGLPRGADGTFSTFRVNTGVESVMWTQWPQSISRPEPHVRRPGYELCVG